MLLQKEELISMTIAELTLHLNGMLKKNNKNYKTIKYASNYFNRTIFNEYIATHLCSEYDEDEYDEYGEDRMIICIADSVYIYFYLENSELVFLDFKVGLLTDEEPTYCLIDAHNYKVDLDIGYSVRVDDKDISLKHRTETIKDILHKDILIEEFGLQNARCKGDFIRWVATMVAQPMLKWSMLKGSLKTTEEFYDIVEKVKIANPELFENHLNNILPKI